MSVQNMEKMVCEYGHMGGQTWWTMFFDKNKWLKYSYAERERDS